MEIKVRENRKGQSYKNIQSMATGNTGQSKHRTKTKTREQISNLECAMRFWNNFLQVRSISKKAKYSFWSNKTKVFNQDRQNGNLNQKEKTKPQQRKLKISATCYYQRQCCNHINRYRRSAITYLTLPGNTTYVGIIDVYICA